MMRNIDNFFTVCANRNTLHSQSVLIKTGENNGNKP